MPGPVAARKSRFAGHGHGAVKTAPYKPPAIAASRGRDDRLSKKVCSPLGPLCEGAPPAGGGGESLAIGRSLPLLFCCFGVGHKQPGDQAERRQPHDDEHGAGQPAHAAAQQPPHSVEPPDAINAPVDAADNGKQKQNLFETRHG